MLFEEIVGLIGLFIGLMVFVVLLYFELCEYKCSYEGEGMIYYWMVEYYLFDWWCKY